MSLLSVFRLHFGRVAWSAGLLSLLLIAACQRLPWQPGTQQARSSDPDGGSDVAPTDSPPPLPSLADHPELRRSARLVARCARLIGGDQLLRMPADASNYGERLLRDAWGGELPHQPQLIVLHETVSSLEGTLAHFQRHHPRDDDQSSYHRLVDVDGTLIEIVPDHKRAFGAGQAAFGDFTLVSRPGRSPSLNNVALHLSLVSPPDGRGDGDAHSGYTAAQYQAVAAQVLLWQAAYGIPLARLATHAAVDRSRTRSDPRSFSWAHFLEAHTAAAGTCGWKDLTRPL
ncbi:MAG: N-acetylmuramoyl-L-alanine amidase [Cyanobacteriota bacterium]